MMNPIFSSEYLKMAIEEFCNKHDIDKDTENVLQLIFEYLIDTVEN